MVIFLTKFEPWVGLRLVSRDTSLRIHNEEFADQILALTGDVLEALFVKVVVAIADLAVQLLHVVPLEGQIATHQSEQDHTE